MVEENTRYKRRKGAYKEQGGIQVPDILGEQVAVTFIGNFLVDGPKICDWVGFDLLRFPACNYTLEPKARQN